MCDCCQEIASEIRGNFAIFSTLSSKGRRCEFLQGFSQNIFQKRDSGQALEMFYLYEYQRAPEFGIQGYIPIEDRLSGVVILNLGRTSKITICKKNNFSSEKYFKALQVGNNALKLKHVCSFTNWIPILNYESKWAPTTLPASDRHCGLGLQT